MTAIFRTSFIAPDSSHWAKWLDAMHSPDPDRRRRATDLHTRLMERGRVPFLSWHHLEEMMGIEDEAKARARVASLQALPMVAWFQMPGEAHGLGSVAQILAAEAIAASEGFDDLVSIRDRARTLLLRTGEGRKAIGEDGWVWEAIRPLFHGHRNKTDMVAALGALKIFDESRTIGEILRTSKVRSPDNIRAQFPSIQAKVYQDALQATGGDTNRAHAMVNEFMEQMLERMPPAGETVRELFVATLGTQGVDEDEIGDDCVLADLTRLGLFRSQLRVVAAETGRSFHELKRIKMDILPSRIIEEALRNHGQPRNRRPASDVHDAHLAVLAAYCDVLYVDKRTAEDFRRAKQKDPRLGAVIGEIAKAADFDALLGTTA